MLSHSSSHVHTLQKIPRNLELPKREKKPTPPKHMNLETPTLIFSHPFLAEV